MRRRGPRLQRRLQRTDAMEGVRHAALSSDVYNHTGHRATRHLHPTLHQHHHQQCGGKPMTSLKSKTQSSSSWERTTVTCWACTPPSVTCMHALHLSPLLLPKFESRHAQRQSCWGTD